MLKIIYWKIRFLFEMLFSIKRNIDVIPKNTPYCYIPDERDKDKLSFRIKLCPYFINFNKQFYSGCKYEKFIGFDLAHWDQCKICDID